MKEEPIKVGNGIMSQIKSREFVKTLTMSALIEAAAEVFHNGKSKKEIVLFTGGTIYYGYGCKNLAQVHWSRICAIRQKKMWFDNFGISKRIIFKYNPNPKQYDRTTFKTRFSAQR